MSNTKMSRAEDLLYTCQDRIRKAELLLKGLPVEQEITDDLYAAIRSLHAVSRTLRSHLPGFQSLGDEA